MIAAPQINVCVFIPFSFPALAKPTHPSYILTSFYINTINWLKTEDFETYYIKPCHEIKDFFEIYLKSIIFLPKTHILTMLKRCSKV